MSSIGFRVQRGMELAAKKAPVKLVFRDTGTNPETAASLTRELAQDANVLAIVGPLSSAVAQSAAEAAQASSLPLIALSQKDGLTQTGTWIFQAFLTPRQQVRALVGYALAKASSASPSSTPIPPTAAPFPRISRKRWRPGG